MSPLIANGCAPRRTYASTPSAAALGTQLTVFTPVLHPACVPAIVANSGPLVAPDMDVCPYAAVVTPPLAIDPVDCAPSAECSTQSRPSSCFPVRHRSAFTSTGLAFRLPDTRDAMQNGKHDVPTATSEHSCAGSRSHRGTSQMVASTLSHVPRVAQSVGGGALPCAANAVNSPSVRRAGHRTLRTEISTASHRNAAAHVGSSNHTSAWLSALDSAPDSGRNWHTTWMPPPATSWHWHPISAVVERLPGCRPCVNPCGPVPPPSPYTTAATPIRTSIGLPHPRGTMSQLRVP